MHADCGSAECWLPLTDERALGLSNQHEDSSKIFPDAKPSDIIQMMKVEGWTYRDGGSFTKKECSVTAVKMSVRGVSGRRIVRTCATGELVDALCFNARTSRR